MKKQTYLKSLALLTFASFSYLTSFSQGTTWNLTGNNNGSSSTFVGTTTSQPLIFKNLSSIINSCQIAYKYSDLRRKDDGLAGQFECF